MRAYPSPARGRRRSGRAPRDSQLPRLIVIGDAPEIPSLAVGLDSDSVAVIGTVSFTDARRLRSLGIPVMCHELDECHQRLLRRAERAVVAGTTDTTTVQLITHLLLDHDMKASLRPLVDNGALAEVLDRHERISSLHRPTVIARAVLAQHPPTLPDRVCPPPIVIGSGVVAREIVSRIVAGWGQPGEPMVVHCAGASSDWVSTAAAELGSRGSITWTELPLAPAPVLRHLDAVLKNWQPPPADHAQFAGPTIVVAVEEPQIGVPLAITVARHLPQARVVALSPGAEPWESLRHTADGTVEVMSTSAILASAVLHPETSESLLAEQLFADAAYAEGQHIWGDLRFEGQHPAPLSAQPDDVRDRIGALVEAFDEILRAGGIARSGKDARDAEQIVLTPGELLRMADEVKGTLGIPDTTAYQLAALELASRLPVIAARAGFAPRRTTDDGPRLSSKVLGLLAPLVHHAYQQVGYATNNATGSPWLYETWEGLEDYVKASNRAVLTGSPVGFAMEGLDWIVSEDPAVMVMDEDRVERLAVLEHRRWVGHQRCNGRPEHTFVAPWEDLDDDTKEYDRVMVRTLPRLLAHAGIQVIKRDHDKAPIG